jgi:transcriptional antiterminator RfaH
MSLAWYAVETLRARELVAAKHLRNQHYEVWVPQMWTTRRFQGAVVPTTTPIFPGYLFAEVDLDDQNRRWRAINSTRGVKQMLQFSTERPSPLRDSDIAAMRRRFLRADGSAVDEREINEAMRDLVAGDEVQALAGPFADFVGIVEWSAKDRVSVLFSLFGRSAPVEMDAADVRRLE